MSSEYEKEFKIFSSNVNHAARAFYYHREISKQVYEDGLRSQGVLNGRLDDSKLFQAVNANAQFWNDYEYTNIVYSIITLGRIFDSHENSHGLIRLVNVAKRSNLFSRDKLRERKIIASPDSHEWIDSYMGNISEISRAEYWSVLRYVGKTRNIWREVKGVRNKLYAHQAVISEEKKREIIEGATYSKLEDLISRLLTIENIFLQAFCNGYKPNLSYKNTGVLIGVRKDVADLLLRLSSKE